MSFKIDRGLFKLNLTDYYAILGVPLDADAKQVRTRYIKIAQRLHPDICKAKNEAEKQQASCIFSKLVNPAYENLSKDQVRAEYGILLSDVSKQLALEGSQMMLTNEAAKQLAQAQGNLELNYKRLLQDLALEQYQSLDQVIDYIAQISELNLSYLILNQGQKLKLKESKTPAIETRIAQPSPTIPVSAASSSREKPDQPTSQETTNVGVKSSIQRAQEYINKGNFANAILELRTALKQEPNNSTSHGLLGLVYLKQNQLSMAKVHINRAWQLNPKDPAVIESKRELNKLEEQAGGKKGKAANQSKAGGIFGGLFGGKKN